MADTTPDFLPNSASATAADASAPASAPDASSSDFLPSSQPIAPSNPTDNPTAATVPMDAGAVGAGATGATGATGVAPPTRAGGLLGVGATGATGIQPPATQGTSTDDISTWQPGQIYSGTSTPGSTSTQSFIPTPDPSLAVPTATWTVTPDQTVQGQMDQLTQNLGTNPVYQSLAAQLTRANAANGGTNSLMAETSAYNSVVGLAYNIASADAATYAQSAEFNASMANQFGLAAQQFSYTALLSDQNYKQSQTLQAEQINGNLQSVSMQISGQLKATNISASAQIKSASISASASMHNADTAAQASLTEASMSQQTTLDSLQIGFQNQWMLNQQGTSNQLQIMGSQTSETDFLNSQQASRQLTLQSNADMNANLRQLTASVGQIGATPGLSPEQQAGAVDQVTQIFKTNQNLSNSYYTASVNGFTNGTSSGSLSGGAVPVSPSGNPLNDAYNQFGNYMLYPGYEMTAPPTAPFFGGSGTTTVGAQPSSTPAAPSTGASRPLPGSSGGGGGGSTQPTRAT